MSTDLKVQIRNLASGIDSDQAPVTAEEVRLLVEGRDGTEPLVGWRPTPGIGSMRSPWPALVAGLVVVLAFGFLAWLLPSGDTVPLADTLPPPGEGGNVSYLVSDVPEGLVLQDMQVYGGGGAVYLRWSGDTWIPSDGGFSIHSVEGRPFGVPEDTDGYLDATLEAVPGSVEVEVSGNRAVFHEVDFRQGDLATALTWVLAADEGGGMFEVVGVGMSREEIMSAADGVQPVSVAGMLGMGNELDWDVKVGIGHNGFAYSPPDRITDLADAVDVALGLDLLTPRLSSAGGESTVVTTQDGEVVETLGLAIRSTTGTAYLEVDPSNEDAVLEAYQGSAELSPERRAARIDRYVEQVSTGQVLSEDPYVIQAPPGPEPRFDVSGLGTELPLVPATSADVVPEYLFDADFSLFDAGPVATQDRPVVVIGTAHQPDSDWPTATSLLWFTESDTMCEGTLGGNSCGFGIRDRFGLGGGSTTENDEGELLSGDAGYAVPLETSVVQIITESQSWWQRPAAGYGVISFGDTVEKPRSIVAFDAEGNEIRSWNFGSR